MQDRMGPTKTASRPHAHARVRRRGTGSIGSALLLGLTIVLVAGAGAARDWGYDLGDELMSPFCPGRTLSSCPSPQAAELVQWIVTQEAAGATREEVLEILVERYGEEILGAPPAEGITLWAYIFPVAGFVLFGGVAFYALRRIVAGAGEGGPPVHVPTREPLSPQATEPAGLPAATSSDAELERLVDAELASRR